MGTVDGDEDHHPLRRTVRPTVEPTGLPDLRVVDLFAGCGGLSLGAELAARDLGRTLDVRLAVDFEASATKVYRRNFPAARDVRTCDVARIFEPVGSNENSRQETALAETVGAVDVLMGGPPCQGHSNLNNHTRRNDPKNALYLYMVRAAQVLKPSVVLIENVPAIRHDTFESVNVVESASQALKSLGYEVAVDVVALVSMGVAQLRKRHLLLATRPGLPDPARVLDAVIGASEQRRDLMWAIGDLVTTRGMGWDAPPKASPANVSRMQYLIDNDCHDLPNEQRPPCHQGKHSYVSMYGRLRWNQPAQTITSGFGSIGQGRYMHPSEKRALTAHEAARIQGFPDYFDFGDVSRRGDLSVMIGNAVPPQLSERIVRALFDPSREDLGEAGDAPLTGL